MSEQKKRILTKIKCTWLDITMQHSGVLNTHELDTLNRVQDIKKMFEILHLTSASSAC